jgi:predicted amidohydrolase
MICLPWESALVRKIRVSTISLMGVGTGTAVERVAHNRRAALGMIEKAALDKPDVVCLPETFPALGLGFKDWFESAETVPGPTTDAVAEIAKKNSMYVVCPIVERAGKKTYNSAVLIDRAGEIVGAYHKIHPTIGELEAGITPGTDPVVLQTDFGPVGFAICFDLNFRDVGEGLKAKGAKLVFFPSMYEGGLQLSAWALDLSFYMASAFTGIGSAIVDPLGRVLVKSSRYMPIISKAINPCFEVMHCDYNNKKWDAIKMKYGTGVEIDIAEPEDVFALYINQDDLTVDDVIRECELERRDEYYNRATALGRKALL